jgi:hypothetical protein
VGDTQTDRQTDRQTYTHTHTHTHTKPGDLISLLSFLESRIKKEQDCIKRRKKRENFEYVTIYCLHLLFSKRPEEFIYVGPSTDASCHEAVALTTAASLQTLPLFVKALRFDTNREKLTAAQLVMKFPALYVT